MLPTAFVVVYYFTAEGEIISNYVVVKFGNALRNFVRIVRLAF
jgi:hypothetical protein